MKSNTFKLVLAALVVGAILAGDLLASLSM
jgi:hypothetical protein